MGSGFLQRIIPLRTFNYHDNDNERYHLLPQACYENPLFDEDGAVPNDYHTKVQRQTDGQLCSKNYQIDGVQTTVVYKDGPPSRRRTLKILGVIVAIIAILGLVVGIIIGQSDGPSESKPSAQALESNPVLFSTREMDGDVTIIKGPFSIFKPEYRDRSSPSYSIFSSTFTYQINSIFAHSHFSTAYSHTEIVNISSGSVHVVFKLHFHQEVWITAEVNGRLHDTLRDGMSGGVFVIDDDSLKVIPLNPALSVIPTSKPGVCLPITMPFCINVTGWTQTTYPNLLGHTGPQQAMAAVNQHQELFYVSCGKEFWCSVFNPRCHHGRGLPPCRAYCNSVFAACRHKYGETNIEDLLSCATLPDSTDPNVCSSDPYPPGTCLPMSEGTCNNFGYHMSTLPNFVGHRSPQEAAELLHLLAAINHSTHCYRHSVLFACAALVPKCTGSGVIPTHAVPPCRSLCQGFRDRCEIFMDIFFSPWPHMLYCSDLPDSNDTNVCIGYAESQEVPKLEDCQAGEERCDNSTCIPPAWKCDDYHDCKDGMDETPIKTNYPIQKCAVCPQDMFRCSPVSTLCVENSRRCDGVNDCLNGADERECVKLGEGGREGEVTVYNPDSLRWEGVCSDGWKLATSNMVCSQLGYNYVVSMTSTTLPRDPAFLLGPVRNMSDPKYLESYLTRSGQCLSGKSVSLMCDIPVCGTRPAYTRPAVRIVGGDVSDPGEWPWLVSIYGGLDAKYFCQGSIIAERWILTAGHCVGGRKSPKYMTLKAGQPRRDTYSPYIQQLQAEEIILFPYYNPDTVDNDLALIKLTTPIQFNDNVRPICLPETQERLPVGTRCTVVGWGKNSETAIDYERQIKKVNLEVVSQKNCNDSIRGAERKNLPYRLGPDMFCAGGTLGVDACSGDSGGPFLCHKDIQSDTWYTAGIVSWGVGCAYFKVPGVYTNVASYLGWIRNVTQVSYL